MLSEQAATPRALISDVMGVCLFPIEEYSFLYPYHTRLLLDINVNKELKLYIIFYFFNSLAVSKTLSLKGNERCAVCKFRITRFMATEVI